MISDEMLNMVGEYFVQHDIHNKYKMDFVTFLHGWERGLYEIS